MGRLILALIIVGLAVAAVKMVIVALLLGGLIFRTKETLGLLLLGGLMALISKHPPIGVALVGLLIGVAILKARSEPT